MGILGKRSLWQALDSVKAEHRNLAHIDFNSLIERADEQFNRLNAERLKLARLALR